MKLPRFVYYYFVNMFAMIIYEFVLLIVLGGMVALLVGRRSRRTCD